jgi:hypothetical protein
MPNYDDLLNGLSDVDRKSVMSAFNGFLEFWESNSFEAISQEEQMVSEKHKFGGCPDVIAKDHRGRLCIIDFKTSDGVYPEYLYQVGGAYRILWNENHPDNPLTGGTHICRFSKQHGDFSHHFYPDLTDAEEGFLLMRRLFDIDKEVKKRC